MHGGPGALSLAQSSQRPSPTILAPRPVALALRPAGKASTSERPGSPISPTLSNHSLPRRPPSRSEKKFVCDYPDCGKAYFKPSRLAEHRLSHTGEVGTPSMDIDCSSDLQRPHVCPHCSQSYLRSSHLAAHLRTHLDDQDRPFECTFEGCGKRFWTSTHLKRHQDVHDKVALYKVRVCLDRLRGH